MLTRNLGSLIHCVNGPILYLPVNGTKLLVCVVYCTSIISHICNFCNNWHTGHNLYVSETPILLFFFMVPNPYCRVLALATSFTTRLIRKKGLLQHKIGKLHGLRKMKLLSLPPVLPDKVRKDIVDSTSLHDLARLLEIVRCLQYRLRVKLKNPSQRLVCFYVYIGSIDFLFLEYNIFFNVIGRWWRRIKVNGHRFV